VYFELADLLLSKGNTDEADRLFRSVVRGAPDEELVARAARLSMQINLGKGTLESLEQDLLPLAIGNPQRPMYRRLLVEIYGSLTFALVQRVRHGAADDAEHAKQALARVGARAVKPLLDALADPDVSQQRIAIDVLAYVQNPNAALPLFAYATGPAELSLRTRAMLACGALADDAIIPKVEGLLFPGDRPGETALGDPVAIAAVWGLARLGDARALPVLRRVATAGPPTMRALAVLGLGLARDAASTRVVAGIARASDAGTVAQAAAAYALGDLNAGGEVPVLLEMAEDGEPLPRQMALLALARMSVASTADPPWRGEAVKAIADAVFARRGEDGAATPASDAVAGAAVAALAALAAKGTPAAAWAKTRETLAVPEGAIDVEALLSRLTPRQPPDRDRAAALVAFAPAVQRAAEAALQTSGPRAAAVLDALGDGEGELLPFVARGATGPAAQAAHAIADALEPALVPLAKHPDAAIRTKALVLVARSSSEAAGAAVVVGLEDASEDVQRVALSAIGAPRGGARAGAAGTAGAQAAAATAKILATHANWAIRVLAARALGRLGAAGTASASAPLEDAAVRDPYALVRQAALEALASFDGAAAAALAGRMAASDPEPRVRDTARALAR
jgi:HEAT repeat protein